MGLIIWSFFAFGGSYGKTSYKEKPIQTSYQPIRQNVSNHNMPSQNKVAQSSAVRPMVPPVGFDNMGHNAPSMSVPDFSSHLNQKNVPAKDDDVPPLF